MVTEVVEDRKKNACNSLTTKILNELLADKVWQEQVTFIGHYLMIDIE
jgi:hypothetical protein